MNAIKIAELLEHSALGNLGDFPCVADAAKELRRLAGVEVELAVLREQEPVGYLFFRVRGSPPDDFWEEEEFVLKEKVHQDDLAESRRRNWVTELYEHPVPQPQLSGNPEQLPDWPEDRGEHPQRGLGVQSC